MGHRKGQQRRVGIYCRVSTTDKNQNIETQTVALQEYANTRNFVISGLYSDIGVSGKQMSRPGLDSLIKAARSREIDIVLVARFDRFARSVSHLIRSLEEFQSIGIDFISLNESIDTSTPTGKMIFTVLAAVAELERDIIVERVKSGLARTRKQGKHLGRPKVIFDREKARALYQSGMGSRTIAKKLGISRETVRKVLT